MITSKEWIKEAKEIDWDRYAVRQFSFFFWSAIMDSYDKYVDFIGKKFEKLMVKYSSKERIYFRPKTTTLEMRNSVAKRMLDIDFPNNFVAKAEKAFVQSEQACNSFIDVDLTSLKRQELINAFKQFHNGCKLFIGAVSSGIIMMDMLSQFIQNSIILPQLKARKRGREINQLMGEISSPNKMIHYIQEELDLIELAEKRGSPDFEKLLEKHTKTYNKMHFFNTHELWTKHDFLKRLDELKDRDLESEKKKIESSFYEKNKVVEKIANDLGLDEEERGVIENLRSLLYLRTREELIISLMEFCYIKMFKETAKRFSLAVSQLNCFTIPELFDLFANKKIDLENVNKRKEHSLLVYRKGEQIVFVGEESKQIFKELAFEEVPIEKFTGELKGTPAAGGLVKGQAKIILHLSDLKKFKPGDILVAPNTNPSYVVAMKKAGAIITDEGGITCHAAIVSRELGIPCVIGTKIATQVLKDGDKVEVNADKGVVKKIS